jgi:hypothetical protein
LLAKSAEKDPTANSETASLRKKGRPKTSPPFTALDH